MNELSPPKDLLLLKTKLNPPKPSKSFVRRDRLFRLLDRGQERKVTLISAPAGFGKTSLLVQWIEHNHTKAAWLSLDEKDNEYHRFFTYFISSLQVIHKNFGETLLKIHSSFKRPKNEYLQTSLVNEISSLTSKCVMVLDDFHTIEDEETIKFISFLIDQAPHQLHLILSTRADPFFSLTRLRARDEVTEIRAADLKFSLDEADKFLRARFDLAMNARDVEILTNRTEGWISGLQMAAISLSSHPEPSALLHEFSSSNRYIMDYMLEEIWRQQRHEIQEFLLKTSVLKDLNAALCRSLTGIEESQSILEELERVNLFIQPQDQERQWYRYHNLFSDLLQSRLRKESPECYPLLCRKASDWHKTRGEAEKALYYALESEEYDLAIQVIKENAESVLMRSQTSTLLSWIESIPEAKRQEDKKLNLYLAWARLMAAYPLKEIEPIIESISTDEENTSILGNAIALNALITSMKGAYKQGILLTEKALAILPEESHFIKSILLDNQGIAYLLQGDDDAALKAFEKAAEISEKTGNLLIAIGALSNMGSIQFIRGKLHSAEKIFQQALEMSRDDSGNYLPIASKPLISLGDIYREWNEFDKASELLNLGKELIMLFGEIGSILADLSLARIQEAQGDYQAADQIMEEAEKVALKFDATTMDDRLVTCYRNNLWLLQGDMPRIEAWKKRILVEYTRIISEVKERKLGQLRIDPVTSFEGMILAKILIYQGQIQSALNILEEILGVENQKTRLRTIIKIMIYMAMAFERGGQKSKANDLFQEALLKAEPEGYHRTFLDEGKMVMNLLEEAQSNDLTRYYATHLLDMANFSSAIKDQISNGLEILTKREKEILGLIEMGYSNRQIGEELFLTVNTVKGYIQRIFNKLDAQNRAHAVTRAREMGIDF